MDHYTAHQPIDLVAENEKKAAAQKKLGVLLKENLHHIQTPICRHSRQIKSALQYGGLKSLMEYPAFWIWCCENIGDGSE